MHLNYSKLKLIRATSILLGFSLIILFGLAWQAVQATRAHYAISDNVLREYAVLISNEYSRRLTQDIGYRGYFEVISEIREQYQNTQTSLSDLLLTSKSADLVEYIVSFKEETLSVYHGSASKASAIDIETLEQTLNDLDTATLGKRPFHAIHFIGSSPQTFVFMLINDDVIGFIVDKTSLKQKLAESFERAPLFPSSLANGKLTNGYIGIFVSLSDDSMLAQLGFVGEPFVTKVLEEEYGGIFEGMGIHVSIDSAINQALIIGEQPLLRLPFLLIALAVAAGLLLVAIRQIGREQALMAMRNRFIAEASHELRTPLAQIRLFAETLMLNRATDEQAKHKALSIINREAQRLGYLVDNILSFSQKAKNRHVTLVEENIEPIVVEAVEALEYTAAQLNSTFNLEIHDVVCLIDRSALLQVLINLLDNALKYGGSGQLVTVRVREQSDGVYIYVIDQGQGIPEEEQDKIWTDFYRPKTSRETGVGIGLSIVRELTILMKGECWLEPMASGACFVLRFPLFDNPFSQDAG